MAQKRQEADRSPLTRQRVLDAAIALADRVGIEPFTIRKLAAELDVTPMAIYHHLPNKEQILDGIVDEVFAEIDRWIVDAAALCQVRDPQLDLRGALPAVPAPRPSRQTAAAVA